MDCTLPSLASVADIAREVPQFREPTLRDLIYHAEPRISARGETIPANGFAFCMVRVGRRILIDRRAFAAWLESKRAAPLPADQRVAA